MPITWLELANTFVQVHGAEDVGLHDRLERLLGRHAAEVQDRVHAFAHSEDVVAVGEVAQHDLFAFACRPEINGVGQPYHVGELVEMAAQALAEVAGRAGEQNTFERFGHRC
jgi:hypothetical protein